MCAAGVSTAGPSGLAGSECLSPAEWSASGAYASEHMVSPRRGELPRGPVRIADAGTDTSLCMSAEPTIAVDPNSPHTIAVAQFVSIQVSFDAGSSFPVSLTAPATDPGGHPSIAFDSQGRLFISYLCNASGGNRSVCLSGYSCDRSTATCALLPGTWPVDVSAASGTIGDDDRSWLAADSTPSSPNRDRLYLVWTRRSSSPWSIRFSSSSDQGRTWSAVQTLSASDPGQYRPSHIAVGPTGRVFAAWHHQPGFLDPSGDDVPDGVSGRIALRRSDDGGLSWQPQSFPYAAGDADVSYNVQHEAHGVIPGAPMWLVGTVQPWILPDPFDDDKVSVVANDDPDNDVDAGYAAVVRIVASRDGGATWDSSFGPRVGLPGSVQILPTAAINPITGAIGVAWYESRFLDDSNGDGVFELDLVAIRTYGSSWSAEVDMNDGLMDPNRASRCRYCGSDAVTEQECGTPACPAPATTRMGEYIGVAFGECTLYVVWTDNASPDCGGDYDTWFDRDPELGGDIKHPVVTCPPDVTIACDDSTAPAAIGSATALDNCDLDPLIFHYDGPAAGNCPAGKVRSRIDRFWSARDAAGNEPGCLQRIALEDRVPPVLALPASLAFECSEPGGVSSSDPAVVAWRGTFRATDACGSVTASDDLPAFLASACPPAGSPTTVTFDASDDCGNADSGQVVVSVVDTTPPAVLAPAPLILACNAEGGVVRSDPAIQAWLALASAADVCSAASLSDNSPALFPFRCPGGGESTIVTFTGSDSCGNASSAASEVSVIDGSPPALACSVAIASLWPPNNKLVDVGLEVSSDDVCDPAAPTITVTVTSDEAPGGGKQCPDAVVGPGPRVALRAERDGAGDGRVYRIRVEARDSCANLSVCEVAVEVRHDSDGEPATDSGQGYEATACD